MNKIYKSWIPDILAIAAEASVAINNIQQRKTYQINSKSDDSPVTEADLLAHHIIKTGLAGIDPAIPFISEEGDTIPYDVRRQWPRFWLVDPLDGTREFIRGSQEFTVNIALIENHVAVLAVVGVPSSKQYWAVRGNEGAYSQSKGEAAQSIRVSALHHPLRVLVSHRFDPASEQPLLERLKPFGDCQLTHCGSSLKICLVAEGKSDLYPQMGKTSEWDTAAGQCILEAAGGQLLNNNGVPLSYNASETQENTPFYAIGDNKLASICCG